GVQTCALPIYDTRLDASIQQDPPRGRPIGAIRFLHMPAAKEKPAAAGQSGMQMAKLQHPRKQARNRGFSFAARDPNQWNMPGVSDRKSVVDDSLSDRTGFARRRLQMHQQSRTRIHFDNGAALSFE